MKINFEYFINRFSCCNRFPSISRYNVLVLSEIPWKQKERLRKEVSLNLKSIIKSIRKNSMINVFALNFVNIIVFKHVFKFSKQMFIHKIFLISAQNTFIFRSFYLSFSKSWKSLHIPDKIQRKLQSKQFSVLLGLRSNYFITRLIMWQRLFNMSRKRISQTASHNSSNKTFSFAFEKHSLDFFSATNNYFHEMFALKKTFSQTSQKLASRILNFK